MALAIDTSDRSILERFSLPPRPRVLMAINDELKKKNPSFPAIAQLIAEDVGIASAALKIVNSPAFRRHKPVGSIDQALNLLGLQRILAIANAVSVRQSIKSNINLEDFWEFGSAVASVGILVAQQCQMASLADDAYTIGLFHDACGPVLMTQSPSYHQFFLAGNAEGWVTQIVEEKMKYDTTHTALGAFMAQDWCLPERTVWAIYHLHLAHKVLTDGERDSAQDLLAITKIAREIARIERSQQPDNPEWLHAKPAVLDYLGLDDDDYEELRDEVLDRLRGT